MSKAEEKAQAVYPAWRNGIGDEFNSNSAYYGFIEGYHQAEKDLELTWGDINNIKLVMEQVECDYVEQDKKLYTKDFYEEVLKRFKERKGK